MNLNTMNDESNSNTSPIQENNSNSSDFRIEIHGFTTDDLNLQRNFTGTMQQNISALIHQARNQLGRQTADSGAWRMNFTNVFQGVRPLSMNNFRTWTNSYRYMPLVNDNSILNDVSVAVDTVATSDLSNHIENGGNGSGELRHSTDINATRNNNRNVQGSQTNNRDHTVARPLLERVTSLTRNDPPDLIGGPSVQRNNRNQSNGNNNEDENAVAELFAQLPEARGVINTIHRYVPLVCILLAKSAYDHIEALSDYAVLIALFIHSNSLVRDQVAKQAQRKITNLFRELTLIALCIYVKFFITDRKNPFTCLPLFSPINEAPTLSQLLYTVAVTDLLLKVITISIKMFIIMLPPRLIKYKGRGRYFVLTEALSQLYRALAPIQLWLLFLLDSYNGMEKALGVLFSAAYMISKGFDIVDRAKLCRKAFVDFFRQVNYGTIPTKDEIQTAGQCPICHDHFDTPVKLECSHIFCELCVGTWFTREQTCPLCRAQVAEDPSWQDGATTFFLQLY